MSTQQNFIDHVVEQADLGDRLVARKMFGELGFHLEGKFIALACDNSLFIKATPAPADNGLDLPTRSPYPGAKPYPVGDELLDDSGLKQFLYWPQSHQALRIGARRIDPGAMQTCRNQE